MTDFSRDIYMGYPKPDTVDVDIQESEKLLETILNKGKARVVSDSKHVARNADYEAEDVMSESTTAGTPYQFNVGEGSGEINKAIAFCDVTALTPRITLYLFSAAPSSNLNDEAANTAPSADDAPIFIGQIDFPALEDLGGGSSSVATRSTVGNLPLPYVSDRGMIYGIAVTRDAITGEVLGMLLSFGLQFKPD